MDQSKVSEKHRSAVISACIALRKYLNDLRRLMVEGESPESTGFNGRPMPLSETEAKVFERELEEMEQRLYKIEEYVGRGTINETQDSLLTRMWASVILGRMEGVLKNIEPKSLERARGDMPPDLKEFLSNEVSALEERVRVLRSRYITAKL